MFLLISLSILMCTFFILQIQLTCGSMKKGSDRSDHHHRHAKQKRKYPKSNTTQSESTSRTHPLTTQRRETDTAKSEKQPKTTKKSRLKSNQKSKKETKSTKKSTTMLEKPVSNANLTATNRSELSIAKQPTEATSKREVTEKEKDVPPNSQRSTQKSDINIQQQQPHPKQPVRKKPKAIRSEINSLFPDKPKSKLTKGKSQLSGTEFNNQVDSKVLDFDIEEVTNSERPSTIIEARSESTNNSLSEQEEAALRLKKSFVVLNKRADGARQLEKVESPQFQHHHEKQKAHPNMERRSSVQ